MVFTRQNLHESAPPSRAIDRLHKSAVPHRLMVLFSNKKQNVDSEQMTAVFQSASQKGPSTVQTGGDDSQLSVGAMPAYVYKDTSLQNLLEAALETDPQGVLKSLCPGVSTAHIQQFAECVILPASIALDDVETGGADRKKARVEKDPVSDAKKRFNHPLFLLLNAANSTHTTELLSTIPAWRKARAFLDALTILVEAQDVEASVDEEFKSKTLEEFSISTQKFAEIQTLFVAAKIEASLLTAGLSAVHVHHVFPDKERRPVSVHIASLTLLPRKGDKSRQSRGDDTRDLGASACGAIVFCEASRSSSLLVSDLMDPKKTDFRFGDALLISSDK